MWISLQNVLRGLTLIIGEGFKVAIILTCVCCLYTMTRVSYHVTHLVFVELPHQKADIQYRQNLSWCCCGVVIRGIGIDVKSSITNTNSKPLTIEVRALFNGVVNGDANLMRKQIIEPGQTINPGYICSEYFLVIRDGDKEIGQIMFT
jgi:hypothetical protein